MEVITLKILGPKKFGKKKQRDKKSLGQKFYGQGTFYAQGTFLGTKHLWFKNNSASRDLDLKHVLIKKEFCSKKFCRKNICPEKKLSKTICGDNCSLKIYW